MYSIADFNFDDFFMGLRVLFGKDLGMALGHPTFRGTYVHFPVMLISLIGIPEARTGKIINKFFIL